MRLGLGRSRTIAPVTLGASIAIHAASLAMAIQWVRAFSEPPRSEKLVAFEVDVTRDPSERRAPVLGSAAGDPQTFRQPEPPLPSRLPGSKREPRPDTRADGRGGSLESERALRLSDSMDGVTLDADPALFTRESQLSRIATGDERQSFEDRRTTPNPMELTFVVTGSGSRLARVPKASADPAVGSFGSTPVPEGARAGRRENEPDAVRTAFVGDPQAGAKPVAAAGLLRGRPSAAYRRSAAVAVARPAIRQGRASVSTTTRGRPADTVDSNQEVASTVQALISASTAGGLRGRGPGGSEGGGAPGQGGISGIGSHAAAGGEGGFDGSLLPSGIEGYAAAVTRKVYPLWEDAFPVWARLEGRGGVAIIGVTLFRDGSIRDLRVVRGSGIPEFDRNVARALEQGSPYGLLPPVVRESGLTLHIAFDAMNPAVGRSGPGPGRR